MQDTEKIIIDLFEPIKKFCVKKPKPLSPSKYISIILVRETKDYCAFRTEPDKASNSVIIPISDTDPELVERLALLASKQKAVERRHSAAILREKFPEKDECYLKDHLCLNCPVCILNGGIKAVTGADEITVKSRILYSTAYSLSKYEDSIETHTFNAIDEKTTKTDQALGERELVMPGIKFISVVTFLAPTLREFVFGTYSILTTNRYGAETRIGGIVQNHLAGILAGNSESVSAYDLTLKLGTCDTKITNKEIIQRINGIMKAKFNGKDDLAHLSKAKELENAILNLKFDKEFLNKMYEDVEAFRTEIGALPRGKDTKKAKK